MENIENELNRIQNYAETILDVVAELRVLANDVPTKQAPQGGRFLNGQTWGGLVQEKPLGSAPD